MSTLNLSLRGIIAADNLDRAYNLADEVEFGVRSELNLGDATLGLRDGTVDSEAPLRTFADGDGGTLMTLTISEEMSQ